MSSNNATRPVSRHWFTATLALAYALVLGANLVSDHALAAAMEAAGALGMLLTVRWSGSRVVRALAVAVAVGALVLAYMHARLAGEA